MIRVASVLRVGSAAVLATVAAGAFGGAAPSARAPTPLLAAGFTERTYAPGDRASLVVTARARTLTIQVFRSGPEALPTRRNDVMLGVPVASPFSVRGSDSGAVVARTIRVPLWSWPSGLYFARVSAGRAVYFAPFVLRPRRLGEHRVAVVMPTNTWQAYNRRDVDGDGVGDTWYESESVKVVDLSRPYLDRGVPPHFRNYDLGFIRWLVRTRRGVDMLADDDLERFRSGRSLTSRYDLIVFPGHEEYVTSHVYDLITAYRNAGGNLMFLSANNFFYRVVRQGDRMIGRTRWRDIGRPEAALIGVQYVDWNENRFPNGKYTVVSSAAASWIFRGTGLRPGSRFGHYGIEIDARTPASPPNTQLVATSVDLFGPGKTAEMTYYETPRGAKVFAAGVINFGASALQPVPGRMLENIWARLARR